MTNPSETGGWRARAALMLACLLLLCAPLLRGMLVLDDPFHHGEYFAAAAALFARNAVQFLPLTIHGALDVAPALLARALWGPDQYLLPTYALYRCCDLLAAVMLVVLAARLSHARPARALLLLTVALLAPLLVGYRDLILLITLWLYLGADRRPEWGRTALPALLLGVATAFGLFWSYDRGLAAALALGAATLLRSRHQPRQLLALLSFGVSTILLGTLVRPLALDNYIASLLVLAQTSAQWQRGWDSITSELTALAILLNLLALGVMLDKAARSGQLAARGADLFAFAGLSLCMLRIGTNRADLPHIYMTLWMPALLLVAAVDDTLLTRASGRALLLLAALCATSLTWQYRSFAPLLVAALAALVAGGAQTGSVARLLRLALPVVLAAAGAHLVYASAAAAGKGQYAWLAHLATPPPNEAVAGPDVAWAARRLQARGARCVFDLSNNGLINALSALPSCSRMTYPVYAGPRQEPELIAALRAAAPPAIVYSGSFWSYAIDGRAMPARFPQLDAYILTRYRRRECAHGYCIGYLKD